MTADAQKKEYSSSFSSRIIREKLISFDQQTVATVLSDIMLTQVEAMPSLGGKEVAKRLASLRDLAWHGDKDENYYDDMLRKAKNKNSPKVDEIDADAFKKMRSAKEARKAKFQALLDGLDEVQTKQLVDGYAKLGHIFEIAGQVARDNFFKGQQRAPGGIEDLLTKEMSDADINSALKALNTPEFIPVLTQHPTNVNSLDAIKAMRQLNTAAGTTVLQEPNSSLALSKAMTDFLTTPLTPTANGKPKNFTVFDETQMVKYFADNIFDDLPKTYQSFDTSFKKKYGDTYHPEELNLKLKLASWGSAGDKDGNQNVKSENTLEAIATHKKAIVDKYLESLDHLNQENLSEWRSKLENASTGLGQVIDEIEKVRSGGNDIPLSNDDFKRLSGAIVDVVTQQGLETKKFEDDILHAYKASSDEEDKHNLLTLLRQARVFGFEHTAIEYRETAEEYSSVVSALLGKPYAKQSEPEKIDTLTDLILNHPDQIQSAAQKFLKRVEGKNLRKYNADNADAITYHTLRRMELARDFPEMIHDNVLAECKNTHNILEAVALQIAVGGAGHQRAKLGVIPLFEESDTLQLAPEAMKELLDNPAYQQHLREVYKDRPFEQQIQIAHSDNARRSGVVGARGFIHAAHEKIKQLLKDATVDGKPVDVVFYQGGSQSDAYRNGVRAITAMSNAFGLHKTAKMTFQGGDLTNYFNYPSSICRILERQFTHSAKELSGKGRPKSKNDALEVFVTTALQNTLQGYLNDHFNEDSNPIGRLFAHPLTDYLREVVAQNIGSRAPERAGGVDATDSAADSQIPLPISTEKMRTISFSEFFSSALSIVASWIGGEALNSNFKFAYERLQRKAATGDNTLKNLKASMPKLFSDECFVSSQKCFKPAGYRMMYEKSPAFKDTIDKLSYGILNTDMQMISRLASSKDDPLTDKDLIDYCNKLMNDHCKVAALVYQAMTGKEYPHETHVDTDGQRQATYEDCERARFTIKHIVGMQHLEVIDPKQRYREFVTILRDNEYFNKPENADIRRLSHSATDTVYHGRTIQADDIRYGLELKAHKQTTGLEKH